MSGNYASLLTALWLLIRRQLGHDLFRTAVSVSAVASGVVIAIAVNAVMAGFETKFVRRTIDISPHVELSSDPALVPGRLERALLPDGVLVISQHPPALAPARIDRPDELLEALAVHPDVAAASACVAGAAIVGLGDREARGELVGIDPAEYQRVVDLEADMVEGSIHDLPGSGAGIVLGRGLADQIGARHGQYISVRAGSAPPQSFRVQGIIYTGVTYYDLRYCYVLKPVAQRLFGLGPRVNRVVLRLHDFERAPEVAEAATRLSGKHSTPWQDANTHVLSLLNTNKALTLIVSIGVLVVAAVGILNVLMMMVMDRRESIALLKSVGYSAREITLGFMGQGLAIGLIGVAVGCVVGYYVVEILGTVPIPKLAVLDTRTLLVHNIPRHYLLAGGVAVAVSVLASVLPALRAGSVDPVEILRGHN